MNGIDLILFFAFLGNFAIAGYKIYTIYHHTDTTRTDAPKKIMYSLLSFGLSFIFWLLVFAYPLTLGLGAEIGVLRYSVMLLLITSGVMLVTFILTISEFFIYFSRGFYGRGEKRKTSRG